MNEERRKILEMLAQGKITPEEADGLLASLGEAQRSEASAWPAAQRPPVTNPKFLRVVVDNGPEGERVNIRIPMQLLRAGIKLAALIPKGLEGPINAALKESGMQIDLNALRVEDLEDLVNHLGELTVDVDGPRERVKVYCE
jgi:hypothetical protein